MPRWVLFYFSNTYTDIQVQWDVAMSRNKECIVSTVQAALIGHTFGMLSGASIDFPIGTAFII